jgi:hypothetical protein
MAERMLKFTIIDRRTPEKRDARERDRDFHEIYADFIDAKATEQASRCSQCGVPFCQTHCPLHNNIPDWLKLTAEGRLEEAYEICRRRPTPCPRSAAASARRTACARATASSSSRATAPSPSARSSAIITDTAWEEGWVKPLKPRRERPASRSASSAPARRAWPRPSAARAGLPGHRLRPLRPGRRPADLRHSRLQAGEGRGRARARCAWPTAASSFRLNFEVGRDATLPSCANSTTRPAGDRRLRRARAGDAGRRALDGVVAALDYLIASNRKGLGDMVPTFESGDAERRRQGRRGHRRRRHGHGLRAHGRAPGREIGHLPLSPRPREHAGLPARGQPTPRKRASSSSGWPPPRPCWARPTASPACAPSACGSARPTAPAARRRRRSRARTSTCRPTRDQGAGLRSRGPAHALSARPTCRSAAGAR